MSGDEQRDLGRSSGPTSLMNNPQTELLGPPGLHNNPGGEEDADLNTGDAFMDSMLRRFNSKYMPARISRGVTAKNSPTYLSSGNPCLDLFFHAVPNSAAKSLGEKLRCAWEHDSLTTLKLICNLRAVRGTGKSDRESFYTAALWLHRHHPRTLARNVGAIAEFGCFKDLPEILYRILEGREVRRKQRSEWLKRKGSSAGVRRNRRKKTGVPREIRVGRAQEWSMSEKERAREVRLHKRLDMAKKVTHRYARNWDFKFLYDQISDHFAQTLKTDLESLRSGEVRKLSLAAKWCPSLDSSFDRSTLLCESIAKRIFPRESNPEYQGIEEAHYAYRVRDRLRKQVLVPLRKALQLPEVFVGADRWGDIPYNRVASVAMKRYKDQFLNHDGERFLKHLQGMDNGDERDLAEVEWQIKSSKRLSKCLAVCDVSRSMRGKPVEACLTLGLLVSEISHEPWKGKIITFGDDPVLHVVEGNNLRTRLESLKKLGLDRPRNAAKDIQKVFDLILQVAEDGKVREEDMIKTVFVFSDMEFDRASSDDYYTNYDIIARRFSDRGYASAVPEIVFWRLRASHSTPVTAKQPGVALVSGFSKNLFTLFLHRNTHQQIDPVTVMESAISANEYQTLVVVD